MAALYSPLPPPPATRTLGPADGPLVWIDCEMTGLTGSDRIIEIACIVTDGNLTPMDEGIAYAIRTPKEVLDNMGEWCADVHGKSGLTANCLDDTIARDHADVRAGVLAYVRERIPEQKVACLAGNTVHADAVFLKRETPELIDHLHYRIVDVSTIKELAGRWYGPTLKWTAGKSAHRALDDIRGSIDELKFYRKHLFLGKEECLKQWQARKQDE